MELLNCSIPAVYIPTPGQVEQVFLAKRMEELGLGIQLQQDQITSKTLEAALTKAGSLKIQPSLNANGFKKHIDRLLLSI
jgi:predicted glycosyltransferase